MPNETDIVRNPDSRAAVRPILEDGADNWTRVPFAFVDFGAEFMTLADSLKYITAEYGGFNHDTHNKINQRVTSSSDLEALANNTGVYRTHYSVLGQPYFKDTRLGANDAINCLWQFNRDDDLVMPMMRTDGTDDHPIGEGMVYAQTIEQNQTIAWFTFGVPKFSRLAEFYTDAFQEKAIRLNALGVSSWLSGAIKLAGYVGALAFRIASAPFRWIGAFVSRFNLLHVDRYYDLRTTMHLYYGYVDSILAHWLVNTGIYGNGGSDGENYDSSWTADPRHLPMALRETGPSMYDIMARKARMIGMDPGRNKYESAPTIQAFERLQQNKQWQEEQKKKQLEAYGQSSVPVVRGDPTTGVNVLSYGAYETGKEFDEDLENPFNFNCSDFSSLLVSTALGSSQFIGFRIEKNVDSSESFSNSTGPNPIAEKINAALAEGASKNYEMGGMLGDAADAIGGVMSTLKDVMSGVSVGFDLSKVSSALVSGTFIDIPEQYKGSDYGKSHSLSFQLRSPYGDLTSIFQSIIVPLACLLAGAIPRAAGPNSYMQPFLCRVYCSGMFSIPMGIIDSISIKRGSSEFGWTYQNLPTAVDVSISIKDLSPMVYMALDNNVFSNWLGSNNSWQEYLLTLAGTGLFERVSQFSNFKRRALTTMHKLRHSTIIGNPNAFANYIGEKDLVKAIGGFTARNKISHR